MKKKQRETSDEAMVELMGLPPTSKPENEDSHKTTRDLAIEEYYSFKSKARRTISDRSDSCRSDCICKNLARKYRLYFANGKAQSIKGKPIQTDKQKKLAYGKCED